MATKQEQAIEIYKSNKDKPRKEVIKMFCETLGMTDAGASTYYYNAKNAVEKGTEKPAAKPAAPTKEKPAPTKEKAKPAPKAAETKETPKSSPEVFSESRARIEQFLSEIDESAIPAFLKKDYK